MRQKKKKIVDKRTESKREKHLAKGEERTQDKAKSERLSSEGRALDRGRENVKHRATFGRKRERERNGFRTRGKHE